MNTRTISCDLCGRTFVQEDIGGSGGRPRLRCYYCSPYKDQSGCVLAHRSKRRGESPIARQLATTGVLIRCLADGFTTGDRSEAIEHFAAHPFGGVA